VKKIYTGKTKDVLQKDNGNLLFRFKDEVTGEDGVVDPGANTVMGEIKGKGKMSLGLTRYYFKLLDNNGVPNHMISADLEEGTMEVKSALMPGHKQDPTGGLEFICRMKAYGSFVRRYQKYAEKMQKLPYLVEITLKDDDRGDPLINDDALLALGILNEAQLSRSKELTRKAAEVIEGDLREKGLYLVDIKFEFGLVGDEVVLIDEVSADCMRVMDADGQVLSHEEIYQRVLNSGN